MHASQIQNTYYCLCLLTFVFLNHWLSDKYLQISSATKMDIGHIMRMLLIKTTKHLKIFIYFTMFSINSDYKNGSILISKHEHGFVSSNLAKTSGCKTPILPIILLLQTTFAQRFGKYAGSANHIIA